jgi:hypothetical protein
MDSMDPDKIDTVEFQLIHSLGSMEDAKNCSKWAIILCGLGHFRADLGLLGM